MKAKIEKLILESDKIFPQRKVELEKFAQSMFDQLGKEEKSNVVFLCTHNSRRSQLAQVWLWTALAFFEIDSIRSFSAGTEETQFNSNMVEAMRRFGFNITAVAMGKNPQYIVKLYNDPTIYLNAYSKRMMHPANPQRNFISVPVCGSAAKKCPVLPGAFAIVPLTYKDPKLSDNTQFERRTYDEKVIEIGREILFSIKHLDNLIK